MNIFQLMYKICGECEKKHTKQWRIVAGYAIEMLDHICIGNYDCGQFPVNGNSNISDINRNILVNHCRAEKEYKGQLDRLCHEVSFGGNFECYNWDLAERFGLKPERWQSKGIELLERQAFYIKKAVQMIEREVKHEMDK